MNVYEIRGVGSYMRGLAIVAADSKKEAFTLLQATFSEISVAKKMYALEGVTTIRKVVYQGKKSKVVAYMDYIE